MKTFKLKSAFTANLLFILFFLANGLLFGLPLFYAIAIVFTMILPACSTTN